MRKEIEALLDGETEQVSFRIPKRLLDAMRVCGEKVYGPLPARGALTTYGLYFLARGIVEFAQEQRKAGQPIVEVEIDNERGRVDVKRGKRGD